MSTMLALCLQYGTSIPVCFDIYKHQVITSLNICLLYVKSVSSYLEANLDPTAALQHKSASKKTNNSE